MDGPGGCYPGGLDMLPRCLRRWIMCNTLPRKVNKGRDFRIFIVTTAWRGVS